MKTKHGRSARLSRREAIGLLGAGVAVGVVTGWGEEAYSLAAAQARPTSVRKVSFPKGTIVRTILKDIHPDDLRNGATLFHEHLSSVGTADEVRAAGLDGVACLTDAATGRRTPQAIEKLRQLANQSGVHIVVAGGYFQDIGLPIRYPAETSQMTEEELVQQLQQDAIAQRWGAMGEIGTSLEMQPEERMVLRAIAKAHLLTGLPIFTHTSHDGCRSCALEQLDTFESQGVNPRSICIGHLSALKLSQDPRAETPQALAKRGAFLGFDTVGHQMRSSHIPEAESVKMILMILEAGYEDSLMLSSDMANPDHMKANWGNGYSSVVVQFAPKLRYAGVKEETIRKILIDNPRRFLAFVPKSSS